MANEKETAIVTGTSPADDKVTIDFADPVLYNGETYSSLTFDFENISVEDIISIDREMLVMGLFDPRANSMPKQSHEFLVRLAARACTEPMIGDDFFRSLKGRKGIKVFYKVEAVAKDFLPAVE